MGVGGDDEVAIAEARATAFGVDYRVTVIRVLQVHPSRSHSRVATQRKQERMWRLALATATPRHLGESAKHVALHVLYDGQRRALVVAEPMEVVVFAP